MKNISIRDIFRFFVFAALFVVPLIWWTHVNQNYVSTKWMAVDLLSVLVCIQFLFRKNIRFISGKILYLMLALTALKIFTGIFHPNLLTLRDLIETSVFVVLTLYFYNEQDEINYKDIFWLYLISSFTVAAFVIHQYSNAFFEGTVWQLRYFGSFGNVNMSAEYILLFLPLGIYLEKIEKMKWKNVLITLCNLSWIFILFISRSRSTWLGLGLYFAYSLYKNFSKKDILYILLPLFLFGCTLYFEQNSFSKLQSGKKTSLSWRKEIYRSSFDMLKDNPFGSGGESFLFSYVPYQMGTARPPNEGEVLDSPHSEFFKWGIEQGWAFLIVAIAAWVTLGWVVWEIPGATEWKIFCRTSFLVLLPQLFFQFPFENPASLFALAFLFSIFISNVKPIEFKNSVLNRAVIFIFVILFSLNAASFSIARYVESQYTKDLNELEWTCHFNPTNWRLCYQYSWRALESLSPDRAMIGIQNDLRLRPFNTFALRALGAYFIRKNDVVRACEVIKVYNMILADKGFYKDVNKKTCSAFVSPLKFENSTQFKEDYLNWLQKYL